MSTKTQELEEKLKSASTPEETVDILNELALSVRNSEIRRSLKLSDEAVKLAVKNNYSKGLATAFWNRGVAYRLLSEYQSALNDFDESLKILRDINDIKEQGKVLNSVANVYANTGDYDNALIRLNESLKIAQSVNDLEVSASILSNIGVLYQETGDFPASIEHYLKSMQAYDELGKEAPEIILNNIGVVYHQLDDYPTALSYYHKSLELALKKENKLDEGFALLNIAVVYGEMKEHDKALEYLSKSLNILQGLGNKHGESDVLRNIGIAYQELEDYEKALEFQFKVLKVREEISDMGGKADTLIHIGDIYCETGKFTNAQKYYKDALKLSLQIKNKVTETTALLHIGKLLIKARNYSKGFEYLFNALKHAESRNAKKDMYEAHQALYAGYKLTGNVPKALFHHEMFVNIEKEISNIEADKKLKSLIVQYRVHAAERERKIALKDNEISRLKNVELAEINQKLKEISDEKNTFLGIAAHDLKNPLSGILSLSKKIQKNFDSMRKEEIIEFGSEIEKASEKMFALVTEVLDITAIESGNRNFTYEEFNPEVLMQRVINDNRPRTEAKNIEVIFTSEKDLKINTDKSALRQILDNLVSNAVKFSPMNKKVYVNVSSANNKIRFEIKDEGPGFTEKDKTKIFGKFTRLSAQPTGGENSSGLGLSIVKNLTEALGGTIGYESTEGQGAAFTVEIPVQNK
jgi:signal transduction histidine kinase/tetratricopeptide (TPR) repeat protein